MWDLEGWEEAAATLRFTRAITYLPAHLLSMRLQPGPQLFHGSLDPPQLCQLLGQALSSMGKGMASAGQLYHPYQGSRSWHGVQSTLMGSCLSCFLPLHIHIPLLTSCPAHHRLQRQAWARLLTENARAAPALGKVTFLRPVPPRGSATLIELGTLAPKKSLPHVYLL